MTPSSDQPQRPFFQVETPMKYALALGALYILPLVNRWLMYGGTISEQDLAASALASLLLINPIATLAAGAIHFVRHGFVPLLPWLFGLAFIPAALIAYNDTALPYALIYTAFGYLGQGAGWLARRVVRARKSD